MSLCILASRWYIASLNPTTISATESQNIIARIVFQAHPNDSFILNLLSNSREAFIGCPEFSVSKLRRKFFIGSTRDSLLKMSLQMYHRYPVWKINIDQTYSCPRDYNVIYINHVHPPQTPRTSSQHYSIEGFKGGPQWVPHYAKRRKSLGQPKREFFPCEQLHILSPTTV